MGKGGIFFPALETEPPRDSGHMRSATKASVPPKNPHPCLTTEWILGQFGTRRRQAGAEYRGFAEAGVGEKGIWEKVQAQSILGEDDFVERLIGYAKGREGIREIPRSQRYLGRPSLARLFEGVTLTERKQHSSAMERAEVEHGYSLKEGADYLGIHYSTVSRAIGKTGNARNKT